MRKRKRWGCKGLLGHSGGHCQDRVCGPISQQRRLRGQVKTDWQTEFIPIHVNSLLAFICGCYIDDI